MAEPDALAVLGVRVAEQRVYEWLVGRAPVTMAELAEHGPAVDRLDAVVAALAANGLVVALSGQPVRYTAVAPDVALEVLLLHREQRMRAVHQYIDELSARYRAHPAMPSNPVVEVVTGRREVRRRIGQLRQAARHELRGLEKVRWTGRTTGPVGDRVTVRTIYEHDVLEAGGVEEVGQPGHAARVLPVLPVGLYLVDDWLALLPLISRPGNPAETAVIVHPCGLFDALAALFEGLWARALPLRPPTTGPTSSPDDRRQDLVALLLSGVTDRTIARELGVGYRTVQRQIAALMRELGATTRFQAGAQAALRDRLDG